MKLNLNAVIVAVVLITTMSLTSASAQSQVGNPTNAYWDGFNMPMALVGTSPSPVYAIYSGDINQDGTIDGLDMNFIDNDAALLAFGYNISDITGDGATDGLDMNFVDNSTILTLFVARP